MDRKKRDLLKHFGKYLTQRMGLSFPAARLSDLERGLKRAAVELGYSNIESLIFDFTSKPATAERLQSLARHLTVGETYFFRDEAVFQVLESDILPELIRARHAQNQELRLWSAGCCTGEEAYSLAISVRKVLPAWRDWNVKILATDINADFLKKAAAGTYGKWSFRTTAPDVKACYFEAKSDGVSTISTELRRMVYFKYLNLAGDDYPSLHKGFANFDVIFCRNVLMYFSAAHANAALHRLSACLAPGGWLVLGPSELSIRPSKDLVEMPFGGMRIYRKVAPQSLQELPKKAGKSRRELPMGKSPANNISPGPGITEAPANTFALSPAPANSKDDADALTQTHDLICAAKGSANRGEFQQAIAACDKAISIDKMNPVAHYLRGILLQEMGENEEGARALKRSIYLDPNFIVAHFALGNLERVRGRIADANKSLENARHIALRYPPDELVPESDGLTTGRLVHIIEALTTGKT